MEQICFHEKINCRLFIFFFTLQSLYFCNEEPIQGGNCGALTFYDEATTFQEGNCKARLVKFKKATEEKKGVFY